ncbi:hypothetical protein D3C76_1257940 [compost metagenome]
MELVEALSEKELDLSVTYEHSFFDQVQNVLSYALLFRDFFQGSQWEQDANGILARIEQACRKQGVTVPEGKVSDKIRNQPLTKSDLWFFKNILTHGIRRKNEALISFFSSNGGAAL